MSVPDSDSTPMELDSESSVVDWNMNKVAESKEHIESACTGVVKEDEGEKEEGPEERTTKKRKMLNDLDEKAKAAEREDCDEIAVIDASTYSASKSGNTPTPEKGYKMVPRENALSPETNPPKSPDESAVFAVPRLPPWTSEKSAFRRTCRGTPTPEKTHGDPDWLIRTSLWKFRCRLPTICIDYCK